MEPLSQPEIEALSNKNNSTLTTTLQVEEPNEPKPGPDELNQLARAKAHNKLEKLRALYSARALLAKYGTMEERRVNGKTLKRMQAEFSK